MTDDRGGVALRRFRTALRRDEDARPVFLDGLLLGAMVGAAIAGSTIWSRWRQGRRARGRESGAPRSSHSEDRGV